MSNYARRYVKLKSLDKHNQQYANATMTLPVNLYEPRI